MPPVMGAGAYMMLQIVDPPVTYLQIIRAALIPALLYYLSLFLITHFHWDHIIGFPFFHPIHAPGTKVHFYSPFSEEDCRANISMLFDGTYSPLRDIANLNAELSFHRIGVDGESTDVNGLEVQACQTTHSATCYAYRLKGEDVNLGFVTDHERATDLDRNQKIVDMNGKLLEVKKIPSPFCYF